MEFKEGGRTGHGARRPATRATAACSCSRAARSSATRSTAPSCSARTIEITNATGDVRARGRVRQTRGARRPGRAPRASGGFLSRRGRRDGDRGRPARLRGQGPAGPLRGEGPPAQRQGRGAGGHPGAGGAVAGRAAAGRHRQRGLAAPAARPKDAGKTPPAPVEGRAAEMVYEAARREIVVRRAR